MIPMKRERMLTIRVTDDEHARLLERCEGKQLAVWMRRVCLGEPVARSGKLPTLAPPLLRQLAAIGNNLNQTARKVNSGQWSSGDRVQALTEAGLEVVRVTRSSISIADPNGGRNIRLKGAFYEQSFTDGRGVREKAERESRIYRENAERRVQEARRVCQRGCDLKRDENQRRYSPVHSLDREIAGKTPGRGERGDDAAQEGRVKAGREYGHDVTGDSLSPVYREWRDALVSWRTDTDEPGRNQEAGRDIAETEREDMGRGVCAGREQEIPCPSVREISGGDSLSGERVGTSEGVTQSDRAGNTFAERLRAAATGLYAAAERMGERLRGIAEDVFAYATGQRDAERAGHAVESAGAALERADRTLEPVIQRELEIREERLIQEREHALSLERERQPEIQERTLDGPSLGW